MNLRTRTRICSSYIVVCNDTYYMSNMSYKLPKLVLGGGKIIIVRNVISSNKNMKLDNSIV